MKSGEKKGQKEQIYGYWLDILVSPFVSFGIDCDRSKPFANDLFHIVDKGTGNARHRYHAAEVGTYNIVAMMFAYQVSCLQLQPMLKYKV